MPEPIQYNRSTWENQKRLLKANDDWESTKEGWVMVLMALGGIGCAVAFVACVVVWRVSICR